MDKSRGDGPSSPKRQHRSDSPKRKEISEKTWQDVRHSRNYEEAPKWLKEQQEKDQITADFEKGVLSYSEAKSYVNNSKDYKGSWEKQTDSSSEHKQREKEIASLTKLTEKSASNRRLMDSMRYHSREILSHSGYEHDDEITTTGDRVNDQHRSDYKEVRDKLLKQNADKLGLKHFASDMDKREDEIKKLTEKVPEGNKHPLLIEMQKKNDEIYHNESNINAFGSYNGDIAAEVDTLVREYKEIRDQFINEFGE